MDVDDRRERAVAGTGWRGDPGLDRAALAGGLDAGGHRPLDPVQQRFSDGDAEAWAARVAALRPDDVLAVGAAVHSVRAVPADQLATVAGATAGRPLHVHLSEQPAENDACRSFYGCTPTELLDAHGAPGPGRCRRAAVPRQ